MMKTPENYYNIADVMKLTGFAQTKSQQIVRELNAELKAKGYMIIPGIIPKKYYRLRFGLDEIDRLLAEKEKAASAS